MRFYSVDTNPDRFQFLLSDEGCSYRFDGRPYQDEWNPPNVFSYKPNLPEPDFWDFGIGASGAAWAIRPEAFEKAPELRALLGYSGELLPLPFGDREFTLYNVTECIDILDEERTVWDHYDDGSIADVREPVFRLDRIGENLFKTPQNSSMRIYYWEDEEWRSQLRGIVEGAGLKGLDFGMLYSTS